MPSEIRHAGLTTDQIEFCTHAYNFLIRVSSPAQSDGSDLAIARDLVWNALADTGAPIFVEANSGRISLRPAGSEQQRRSIAARVFESLSRPGELTGSAADLFNDDDCRRFLTAAALRKLNINQ